MEHALHVTRGIGKDSKGHILRSRISVIRAETDLGPSPQLGIPESIRGKVVGLTTEELVDLQFGSDVEVGFEGRRYRFTRLDKDGTFELQKDW